MSVFYDLNKTPRNILNQAIVRAIVSENDGALFDPSDMSTMYQDATGTTPVTAVEQPVGKILDKSGNGNHATQSVTASRPVLSARYNLLTKTEDFTSTSVWIGNGVNITSNVHKTPFSLELLADKLVPSTSNNPHFIYFNMFPFVSGTSYTFSVYCAAAGLRYIQLTLPSSAFGSSQHANFDLQTGTITQVIDCTASIEACPNGFYRISITKTCLTTTSSGGGIAAIPDQSSGRLGAYLGDGVSGCYVWGADIKIGTTTGPYQRVNTATDYDTNPALFPKYLKWDAVDDYLNLPFMNLYSGGAASIICARDAISQVTDTYIISERSTTSVSPQYLPSRQLANSGNMDAYIANDTGAAVLDTVGSPFSGVANAVIRSIVDSGNNLKLFKNGVLAANDDYTRSGTLTLNNTTIGASVSTTTRNYASMKMYGLIVTKSALTDAQRIKCERYAAIKAGVIL